MKALQKGAPGVKSLLKNKERLPKGTLPIIENCARDLGVKIPEKSTPAVKKITLSAANRAILAHCAQEKLKTLERLHWNILPFLNGKTKPKERQIQHDILKQIAQEVLDTEKAIEALNETYVCQFPKSRRETKFPTKKKAKPTPIAGLNWREPDAQFPYEKKATPRKQPASQKA